MTSIIHKSPDAFTDTTLPRLTRDPLVVSGDRFRLDFTDDYTLNGLAAGAAVADASVLKNLVDGYSDATAINVFGATVATGKLGIVSASASTNPANLLRFPVGDYDMHDEGDDSFIVHYWANQDASGNTTSSPLFGSRDGTSGTGGVTSPIWSTTPAPFFVVTGATATIAQVFSRSGGTSNSMLSSAGAIQGAASLVSFAWTPTLTSLYINGALVTTAAAPSVTVPSQRSHATITASGNVSNSDTVVVNGTTITFVTSGATGAQVNIGADAAASLAALKTYINANSATLNARAEQTTGQVSTVLTVLHTGASLLTLTKSATNLALSSITQPYRVGLFLRGIKGTVYAVAMRNLTEAGQSAAAAALAEYTGFKARLQGKGVTVA